MHLRERRSHNTIIKIQNVIVNFQIIQFLKLFALNLQGIIRAVHLMILRTFGEFYLEFKVR